MVNVTADFFLNNKGHIQRYLLQPQVNQYVLVNQRSFSMLF